MLDKKRHRKRRLILENKILPQIFSHPKQFGQQITIFNYQFEPFEPVKMDRFVVQLEDEHKDIIIPPTRIKGLKFFYDKSGQRKIKIEAYVSIDEWIDDFSGVNICKVFLLNAVGEVIKYLDYDVVHSGHEYELNYSNSEPLQPCIYYTVFD